MGQGVQINKPIVLNLDRDKKSLSESEMFYALNHDILEKSDCATPFPANYLGCVMEMPEGDNYSLGSYYSNLTNETYVAVGNTNNNHFIYRITGDDGFCEKVYVGDCLRTIFGDVPDVFNPKHALEQWRWYLRVEKICTNRHGKELIITNGLGEIACIDVEASIATDFFTTPFFDICSDECAPLQLCVPSPCGCIEGEFAVLDEEDTSLTNHLIDVGVKFAYQHIYYDNRRGDVSSISALFYQAVDSCFDSAEGQPRCIKLTVPLGNPLVDKVDILFSTDNGVNWLRSDTVEKYESYSSTKQYWYERELKFGVEELTYDGCSFYYNFCNDKQCEAVDPTIMSRVYNPIPRQPQGILTIKDALGFYNYLQGNCPIDQSEIDKIIIDKDCTEGDCTRAYNYVTVRAIIHNRQVDWNQFIFRAHGGHEEEDDKDDPAEFGGIQLFEVLTTGLDQSFSGQVRDFKPYIEGTDNVGEMEQWYCDNSFSNRRKIGVIANADIVGASLMTYNGFFYHEVKFKVASGTKGFVRMQSHKETGYSPDTSTYIWGTIDLTTYSGHASIDDLVTYQSELYFDTCEGDVEFETAFVIDDNRAIESSKMVCFNGYITDINNRPLEGLLVEWDVDDTVMAITDHNGFYHFYHVFEGGVDDEVNYPVRISGEVDCSDFGELQLESFDVVEGVNVQIDIKIDDEDYADDFYAEVVVNVEDCDGYPIGGVPVAVSGSKYDITDAGGEARIRIRNYSTRDREVRGVVMDKSGCFLLNCDDECNPCMPDDEATTPACYTGMSGTPEVTLTTFVLNRESTLLNRKGLKKGGQYEFAAIVKWPCGKISAAYPIGTVSIPKLQEDSNEGFCSFTYDATGLVLPTDATCVEILRSENLNPYVLQWVVDDFKRENGKIVLTIQSLNDYNSNSNFTANTVYKWLKGDRVEFIRNGDGNIFLSSTYGLLNYQTISPFNNTDLSDDDTTVDYFNQLLIVDDDRLGDLEKGAVIEIQRAKTCVNEPAYYGICVLIPLVNGEPETPTGTFTTFDTFWVSRIIGSFYIQNYESKFPSDFWVGNDTGFSDVGRAYFANKFENERRYGRNLSLGSPFEFNYFGDIVKTFDAPEQGDITAMSIIDGKVILAIGEYDTFLAQVSDSLVRIGNDGIVRAAPPDQIISDAEAKLIGQFGCKYNSIGSIYFGDGYARFVDIGKAADVVHNYNYAKDVTQEIVEGKVLGRTKSYFKKRCAQIQFVNAQAGTDYLSHYRFASGINRHNNSLYLTIKTLQQSGINNSQAPYILGNETIVYHPAMNAYLGFTSFTPESYGISNLQDENGCAYISFMNGKPYITPIIADEWNSFFGESCDWVIGISMNKYADKIKRGLAIEIQDATALWYVSKVETEVPNWLSEIPVSKATKREDKINLAFLSNKNSRGGLYGDDRPRGYSTQITLVRNNSLNLAYNSIDDTKRKMYSELSLIIMKFLMSEQSGFSNTNP